MEGRHVWKSDQMCYAVRGSRQIFLNSSTVEREMQTWIRLEDGTISAPVHLNSTYGDDKYTPVAGEQTSATSRIHDISSHVILVLFGL